MDNAIQTIADYMRAKGLTPDWFELQRAEAFLDEPVHDLSDIKIAEGPYTVHQIRFVEPSPELFARLLVIKPRSLVYLADGLYEVTRKEEQVDCYFFEFRYHRVGLPLEVS